MQFEDFMQADTLQRAFAGKLAAWQQTGAKLQEEYRHRTAEILLHAGITLIPCDELLDNQFVVSRGIYEAAKEI